jgi:hypothetical protein
MDQCENFLLESVGIPTAIEDFDSMRMASGEV